MADLDRLDQVEEHSNVFLFLSLSLLEAERADGTEQVTQCI